MGGDQRKDLIVILDVPTSDVARAATAFAEAACDPHLQGHNLRTYLFGRMLVPAQEVDLDVAYVASLLHDMGLTEAHMGHESFEKVGAEVAAAFLEQRGWQPPRIRLVEQAIVRHIEVSAHEVPELLLVQAGATLDVAGIPDDAVGAATTVAILERHPRAGFPESIRAAYLAEIERQPEGAFAKLEEAFTLSERMLANPLDG